MEKELKAKEQLPPTSEEMQQALRDFEEYLRNSSIKWREYDMKEMEREHDRERKEQ